MANGSFTQKLIKVGLTLAEGAFGEGKGNTKIIENLSTEVHIRKSGKPAKNECVVKIHGMLAEDMNILSTEGINPLAVRKNLIQIDAGDSDGLTALFLGEITGAFVKYHAPPDLFFEIHAVEGFFHSVKMTTPTSGNGATPVAGLMKKLADDMGLNFSNEGVTAMVDSPYLVGPPFAQALALAQMSGIEFGVDDGVLYIAPRGIGRAIGDGDIPLITPDTGMKDYPTWDKKGLVVETLLNPNCKLGGLVAIRDSAVIRANGQWRITGLEHRVSAKHQHSRDWMTKLHLTQEGI